MALGPTRSDDLTPEELAACDAFERDLDSALEPKQGLAGTITFVVGSKARLTGPQIEELERRYLDAGWSNIEIRPQGMTFGGAHYQVRLER